MFGIHQGRKQALPDNKKQILQKWPYWIFFAKGLQRGCLILVENWKISLGLFLEKMGQKIMFDDRLVRKRALLDYKKADFIKWLYWIFLKGVNP